MCFDFLYNFYLKQFLFQEYFSKILVINVKKYSCKIPVIFLGFLLNLNFLEHIFENFIKINLVVGELFHANMQTDGQT
jgi:hypothetical protein